MNPQCIGGVIRHPVAVDGTQIHDLAFDGCARRVGPETVDANQHPVRLAVQHSAIGQAHCDDPAIHGTDDTERRCGNPSPRVAKHQDQNQKDKGGGHRNGDVHVAHGKAEAKGGDDQEWNALAGDKWIASTFQYPACSYSGDPGPSPALSFESIRF